MSGAITAYKCETCGKISEATPNPDNIDAFKVRMDISIPNYLSVFPPLGWFTLSHQEARRLCGDYYLCSAECVHLLTNMLAAGIDTEVSA